MPHIVLSNRKSYFKLKSITCSHPSFEDKHLPSYNWDGIITCITCVRFACLPVWFLCWPLGILRSKGVRCRWLSRCLGWLSGMLWWSGILWLSRWFRWWSRIIGWMSGVIWWRRCLWIVIWNCFPYSLIIFRTCNQNKQLIFMKRKSQHIQCIFHNQKF